MKRSADLPLDIRPVIALVDEYPAGYVDKWHSHARSQLCLARSGVMSLTTERTSFVLPPNRAVWLPAGQAHQVTCLGRVSLQVLYIDPALPSAPMVCCMFEVSNLVRALIDEVIGFEPAYDVDGREGRIVALMLDELQRMPARRLQAPMPADRRLRRVCDIILADPADARDLDDWARVTGMARRTLTRTFRQETGMGLATWRQQVRLMAALSLLSTGRSITNVAYDVAQARREPASALCRNLYRLRSIQAYWRRIALAPVARPRRQCGRPALRLDGDEQFSPGNGHTNARRPCEVGLPQPAKR